MTEISPELLLSAYAEGIFPMAEDRKDPTLFWVDPELRGILPFETFHVPRRLQKTIRQEPYELRIDTAFRDVMINCAESSQGRSSTWISDRIIDLYSNLHTLGYAHSVECWKEDRLVGGLYGVSIGRAFFGESMFSKATDASKIALVYLVARLHYGGYKLLDTQFVTEHLRQFGAVEIPRTDYKEILETAVHSEISSPAIFSSMSITATASDILQSINQMS